VPLRALCKAPGTPLRVHVLNLSTMWGACITFLHVRIIDDERVVVRSRLLFWLPSLGKHHFVGTSEFPVQVPPTSHTRFSTMRTRDSRPPGFVWTCSFEHHILQKPSLASSIFLERMSQRESTSAVLDIKRNLWVRAGLRTEFFSTDILGLLPKRSVVSIFLAWKL
jgi:hypothetical protein